MPEFAYDTTDLPSQRRYFSRYPGATILDEYECVECEGTIWSVGHDRVCDNCSTIVGSGSPETDDESDRPTYDGTDRPVLYGAFLHAHDWGGDDTDPESFY